MADDSKPDSRPILNTKIVHGMPMPYIFNEDTFESAINYKPRPDDLFLITYPKCGTTWTHQILYLLFHRGEPPSNMADFFRSCPFLEVMGAEAAEKMPRPGAIKMHTSYHMTPRSPTAKYIVVARNPKDTCVSFYYHTKKQAGSNFENATFDDFFEVFVKGECYYGDYFDNVLSWYEHRSDPNVLFVTYEDMQKDLASVIRQMADFIGPEWSEMLEKEPEIVDKIIKGSTVEAMRKPVNEGIRAIFENKEARGDLPEGVRRLVEKADSGKKKPSVIEFVRKGIVGDWKNHFTEEQNRRMNERIAEKTKGTDFMDLWKDCDIGL